MADIITIKFIEDKIKFVEAEGFGEVTIKIKNGAIWRVINTIDTIVKNGNGTHPLDKGEE